MRELECNKALLTMTLISGAYVSMPAFEHTACLLEHSSMPAYEQLLFWTNDMEALIICSEQFLMG